MSLARLDLWTGTSAMRRINRNARLALIHGNHDRRTRAWIALRAASLMFSWGVE